MCEQRRQSMHLGLLLAQAVLLGWAATLVFAQGDGITPHTTVTDLRLMQLEHAVGAMQAEHTHLLWLLIGNLCAAVASLVTYLITHRRVL